MVVIFAAAASATSVWQDFAAWPSRRTVQVGVETQFETAEVQGLVGGRADGEFCSVNREGEFAHGKLRWQKDTPASELPQFGGGLRFRLRSASALRVTPHPPQVGLFGGKYCGLIGLRDGWWCKTRNLKGLWLNNSK